MTCPAMGCWACGPAAQRSADGVVALAATGRVLRRDQAARGWRGARAGRRKAQCGLFFLPRRCTGRVLPDDILAGDFLARRCALWALFADLFDADSILPLWLGASLLSRVDRILTRAGSSATTADARARLRPELRQSWMMCAGRWWRAADASDNKVAHDGIARTARAAASTMRRYGGHPPSPMSSD